MSRASATAKINLALVVGPKRADGYHEVATVLQRIDLADRLDVEPAAGIAVDGLAAGLGADVPFFLTNGPQLGTAIGTRLEPLDLPQDYRLVIVLPHDARKASTAEVYRAFDRGNGFEDRREALLTSLAGVRQAADLEALPPNDLASSPVAGELRAAGAFRADVSGAGPAVYGLFLEREEAVAASRLIRPRGRVWITAPAWYG